MSKCIVRDCPNMDHYGTFVGALCKPCHSAITQADIGEVNANNFIQRVPWLHKLINERVCALAEKVGQLTKQKTLPLTDIEYDGEMYRAVEFKYREHPLFSSEGDWWVLLRPAKQLSEKYILQTWVPWEWLHK